jgi:hypothetical protein
MNTNRDAKGRFTRFNAIVAAHDWSNPVITTGMIVRGPDFCADGWQLIGPRAAVSVDMDRDTEIADILAMPRFVDSTTAGRGCPPSTTVPACSCSPTCPPPRESWGLMAEAVSL